MSIQLPSSVQSAKVKTFLRGDENIQAVGNINPIDMVSGSITANGQSVQANVADAGSAVILVSGTYGSVAVAFEASLDGVTWVAVNGARSDSATIETASGTLSTTTRAWEFAVAGYNYLRARTTAYTSGTMAVQIGATPFAIDPVPAVSLAAGTAVIGYTALGTKTTGGATIAKLVSAASTNATSLKASAGTLYGCHATNNGAAFAYVKFYNKASAPTVGTDVPVAVFGLPPNSSIDLGIPEGIGAAFATGIAYAITGAMADADTTAVAANQVALTLSYA